MGDGTYICEDCFRLGKKLRKMGEEYGKKRGLPTGAGRHKG